MSFRGKLGRIFSKSPTVWESADLVPEPVASEAREHERYEPAMFLDGGLIHIDQANSGQRKIISISYGGFALSVQDSDHPVAERLPGTLKILGDACPVEFNILYKTAKKLGCQFVHADAHVLVFLRQYLEYLRRGATLFAVDAAHLKQQDASNGTKKLYYQGEGPVDLILHVDAEGQLLSTHLTFRDQDQYLSVQFEKGQLQTAIAIDQVGVGARMAPTREVDMQIIKKALFLLAGAPVQLQLDGLCKEFCQAMLACFDLDTGSNNFKKPA